ncbi:hypothetical protein [Cysteiniphilum marinum]|uniref:hypothetical protein n=2 Tax=Fastidiosibacteraceae TaxID=2056687 RepID=UPI00193A7158|nr:hypothetical protein [Cysteiniphilum marinum]
MHWMKKTVFCLTSMTVLAIAGCGGSGGTSSGSAPIVSPLAVSSNMPEQLTPETAIDRSSEVEVQVKVGMDQTFEMNQVGAAESPSKSVHITAVSISPTVAQYVHLESDHADSCWSNGTGVNLQAAQSCNLYYSVESLAPTAINGDVKIALSGASQTAIEVPVKTIFKPASEMTNVLQLQSSITMTPGGMMQFVIHNPNNEAVKGVKIDLSHAPDAVIAALDLQDITGGHYSTITKMVSANTTMLASKQTLTIALLVKPDENIAGEAIKYFYQALEQNKYHDNPIFQVIADNAQDLVPISVNAYSVPATLSSLDIKTPGEYQQTLTNHSTRAMMIKTIDLTLPQGVTLKNMQNTQNIQKTCQKDTLLAAGRSCVLSYQVADNAYQAQDFNKRFANINYFSDQIAYSTQDQVSDQDVTIAGADVGFKEASHYINMDSHNSVINVAMVNHGAFAWQLPNSLDAFQLYQNTTNQPLQGDYLSVIAPTNGQVSCAVGGTLAVNSTCYIGIKYTQLNASPDAKGYRLSLAKQTNITAAINSNIYLTKSGVNAEISQDDNTVYPSVKAIKLTNTNFNNESVLVSLTNDNLKQFSVYDGTQSWCSANTCPKSCFNSDQLFTKGQINTLTLDAYSTKSDNTCYIYVKGQDVNTGDKATALLQIDKLGAHADKNKRFNFTASGVLYASVNSQTTPYVYQYDQAGWHVLFVGKSTGEYMLNSFISGVGISPQGVVFISNGYQTLKRPFLPDVYPPVLGKRFTSVLSINGQNTFLGLSDALGDLGQRTHIKINSSGQIVVSNVGMIEDTHAYIAQASTNDFNGWNKLATPVSSTIKDAIPMTLDDKGDLYYIATEQGQTYKLTNQNNSPLTQTIAKALGTIKVFNMGKTATGDIYQSMQCSQNGQDMVCIEVLKNSVWQQIATFPNDTSSNMSVAFDSNGNVYFSSLNTHAVYYANKNTPRQILGADSNPFKQVNIYGLKTVNDTVYVLASNGLYTYDQSQAKWQLLANLPAANLSENPEIMNNLRVATQLDVGTDSH